MQCDTGCGKCCGPVPCLESEYQRVEQYVERNGIIPVRQGTTCPFYQNGQCVVYAVRPFTCRAFGHFANPMMTCCRGYNTDVDRKEQKELERAYMALAVNQRTRMLHEILPDGMSLLKSIDRIPSLSDWHGST